MVFPFSKICNNFEVLNQLCALSLDIQDMWAFGGLVVLPVVQPLCGDHKLFLA